jgi:DNA-binding transcriptional regulator YbjK
VEAAMTQEMAMLRQHLESRLQESVREAVRSFSERIAEHVVKAVAEQATDRITASVAEERATSGADVDELDEKIRLAAQAALGTLQEVPRKLPLSKRRRKSPK